MVNMIERGLHGGISMAANTYAKANNKYLTQYLEQCCDPFSGQRPTLHYTSQQLLCIGPQP